MIKIWCRTSWNLAQITSIIPNILDKSLNWMAKSWQGISLVHNLSAIWKIIFNKNLQRRQNSVLITALPQRPRYQCQIFSPFFWQLEIPLRFYLRKLVVAPRTPYHSARWLAAMPEENGGMFKRKTCLNSLLSTIEALLEVDLMLTIIMKLMLTMVIFYDLTFKLDKTMKRFKWLKIK